MSKWFQTRRFLWEFPIGSHVKLSSAVVAILVGGLKCQTYFWKGATQGSFQQSLVEIGSVVSEEKIFFKFHPLLFYIFSLAAILVGSRDNLTQFWKGAIQGLFHQSLVAHSFWGRVHVAHLLSFLCCVFVFCMSLSSVLCVHVLPVSLDCPFLIAPSVFSNLYYNDIINKFFIFYRKLQYISSNRCYIMNDST